MTFLSILSILSIDRIDDVARSEESKKRTDDDPNNKRTRVFPSLVHVVTIQQNEKIIRHQLITHCSSDRTSLSHLSSSSSMPTLTCMCFPVRFYECVYVCMCVCACYFDLLPSIIIEVSLCFSPLVSLPLDVTSLVVVVVWALVFSSLVLIVSLENGCIDSRNVEN